MNHHRALICAAVVLAATSFCCHRASADDAATEPSSSMLGEEFKSSTTGIAFCPPADAKKIPTSIPDQIVEFDNDARHWVFKARWTVLKSPTPLVGYDDPNMGHRDGLVDQAIQDIQHHPDAQILHNEVLHVGADGKIPVDLLVVRFDEGMTTRLMQQAIVQANDQLYYVLQLDTPGRAGGTSSAGNDPDEQFAFDTFSKVVDSIRLLDRGEVRRDQDERLIRTRALYANLTEPYIRRQLIPDRYFRILRDGRDVGYSHQTQVLDDQNQIGGVDSVRLGIQTHTQENGVSTDIASVYGVTVDRKHEEWIADAATHGAVDGKPIAGAYHEVGVSEWRIRPVPAAAPGQGLNVPPNNPANVQPGINMEDEYILSVNIKRQEANLPKFEQNVPLFYIPQALDRLIPELVPYKETKTYMFATYVGDGNNGHPAIMSEYVDVLPAQSVELNGSSDVAVPIQVRLGLDGGVTTYYVNADDGSYLGSVANVTDAQGNISKLEVYPSDLETLKKLWAVQPAPAPQQLPEPDPKSPQMPARPSNFLPSGY